MLFSIVFVSRIAHHGVAQHEMAFEYVQGVDIASVQVVDLHTKMGFMCAKKQVSM